MRCVDEVFEDLMNKYGDDLFNVTKHTKDISESEAKKIMDDFIKNIGKDFGDD
jgi:hypothetical protein